MKVFHSQDIEDVEVGDILISEPLLPDTNFSRSVILVCENTNDTHFGFIINKPLIESRLQDMLEGFQDFDKEVLLGGPVQQDHLQCIYKDHTISNSLKLKDGLYWGGDFDEIAEKIKESDTILDDFWFFLGYSGWSEGQLRQELKDNSWLVCRHNLLDLLSTPAHEIWKKSMMSLGKEFEIMTKFPKDARLN